MTLSDLDLRLFGTSGFQAVLRPLRRFVPLVLALAAPGLAACDDPVDTPVVQDAFTELDADAVMFGMEDFLTEDGVRSGLVRADTAYLYDDSSTVKMWGVDMTLFHEDGRERARVTSDSGRLNRRTEVMVAYGDVVALVDGGQRRVETEELNYDPANERIWSDQNSTFIDNGRVTRGTCFRSDLQFRNYTVCNIRGSAGVTGPGGGG